VFGVHIDSPQFNQSHLLCLAHDNIDMQRSSTHSGVTYTINPLSNALYRVPLRSPPLFTAAPRALCATVTAALAVGATAGHSMRGVPCCGVCVAAAAACVRGKVDMKSQVFPRFLLRNNSGRGAKSQPGGNRDRFRRQQQNLSIWQQIPVSSIDRAKIGCWPR
jgi:hypothetical protein